MPQWQFRNCVRDNQLQHISENIPHLNNNYTPSALFVCTASFPTSLITIYNGRIAVLLNWNYRAFPPPSPPPPPLPRRTATITTTPKKISVVADVHYSASRGLLPIIFEEEVDEDGYARVSMHGYEDESNGEYDSAPNSDPLDSRGTLLSAAQNTYYF